ncbi:MAG: aminomethyl-transferring glycine dehydrogenase subunit GcvPA [Candidatus Altiarchaeota archaeon]|nr:aminomethyl-transferring glycine dehydrogenase subunit GcvPA [Candidatus Altiarchaeota archaeon]
MDYIPNSSAERREMLSSIGAKNIEELFKDIPDEVKLKRELNVAGGLSEIELVKHLRSLAGKNRSLDETLSFLGAGMYNHHVPEAVDAIISRSEFYTAYTPYQAEISQGVLQALYEYQTMVCELTGMDASNASMYDGSTALAEACLMARNITGKKDMVVSDVLHPEYREVLRTYGRFCGFNVVEVECGGSLTSSDFKSRLTGDTAAVIVQNPNFFGVIEDYKSIRESLPEGVLMIACVIEATSLGLIKPPSEADIVAGEGQSFGNPISFGGPHYGFLATKQEHLRKMPGRLVGATVDAEGKRGFVLTLQAREQHIRREKASSNICTSEALNAIAAAVYLSLLGPAGLRKVAENSHKNAVYLSERLGQLKGTKKVFDEPFYNEFVMKFPPGLNRKLVENGVIGGLELGGLYSRLKDCNLLCSTEVHDREELDAFVETARRCLQ